MYLTLKHFFKLLLTIALFSIFSVSVAGEKVYSEIEFLDTFGGKTQKVFMEKLGKPFKKEQSVKPSGAKAFMTKVGAGKEDKSKRVKVEMWYYKNLVTYDGKRTYKETEITFVNSRAGNIAFFNNR